MHFLRQFFSTPIWFCGLMLAGLCAGQPAQAQSVSKPALSKAISSMAALIETNYVFPAKGRAIAAHLRQQHRRGHFNGVRSWQSFDSLATRTLQQFSHDGHLYVRFDPAMVRELSAPSPDQAAASSDEDPFHYGADAVTRNFGFEQVQVLAGNLGYIRLSEINISEKSLPVLYAAMTLVANTRALIIDLRDNHGGGSPVGAVLESYFLPKDTPLLDMKLRTESHVSKTVAWLTQPKYDKPLYILTNKVTFSAAEAFAYSMQAQKRAKVVGQASGGGAHMNSWYPINEQIYLSVSTGAPTLPGTDNTWEIKGVQPDFVVEAGQELEFIRKQVLQQ